MAKFDIKHDPSLTKQVLFEKLEEHFKAKGYTVKMSKLIGADVTIDKSSWTGVAIKIKQKEGKTMLRVNGYAPSVAVRLLMYGIITMLILMPKWNALIKEVKEFANSPDF